MFLENIKKSKPIIESITNMVTVNDCANAILAIGGSPIMGNFYKEIHSMVAISNAVLINIGELNDDLIKAIKLACKVANELNIPIVLDPVAAGVSEVRNELLENLLNEYKFSVIKGNASEINYLVNKKQNTSGCDVSKEDEISENVKIDRYLDFCKQNDCILAISGKLDLVCDSQNAYMLKNGSPLQEKITGAGCMLGHVIATFIAANDDKLSSCINAISAFNISAEIAERNSKGTLTFRTKLIDELSQISDEMIKERAKITAIKE